MKCVVEYRDHHGKSRQVYLDADSFEDAKARLHRAAVNGEVFELVKSIGI